VSDDLTDMLGSAYATYPGEKVEPGVICLAVIPYVMERCYTIRPLNPDPSSAEHRRYKLEEKNPADLTQDEQYEWQFPYKDLNLDKDEDLLVVKVKRRPVVVLSRSIANIRQVDTTRIQESFWCLPSYTLVDEFQHQQFDLEFIEDVKALTYRCFFPLPYDPHLHDREAMLRFDRMQPITRHLLKPTERRISKEWLLYLHEWVRFYITGRIGDEDTDKNRRSIATELKTAREELMNAVAKHRNN